MSSQKLIDFPSGPNRDSGPCWGPRPPAGVCLARPWPQPGLGSIWAGRGHPAREYSFSLGEYVSDSLFMAIKCQASNTLTWPGPNPTLTVRFRQEKRGGNLFGFIQLQYNSGWLSLRILQTRAGEEWGKSSNSTGRTQKWLPNENICVSLKSKTHEPGKAEKYHKLKFNKFWTKRIP